MSHLLLAIFSCTKLLSFAAGVPQMNWCVLPYYLNVLIMNTLVCSANCFTIYCTLIFFSLIGLFAGFRWILDILQLLSHGDHLADQLTTFLTRIGV